MFFLRVVQFTPRQLLLDNTFLERNLLIDRISSITCGQCHKLNIDKITRS